MLEIRIIRNSKTVIEKIVVEYGTRKIAFNGRAKIFLEKSINNFSEGANLFDCQNDFVARTFSEEEQLELFKLYEQAHAICESSKDVDYKEELFELKKIVDEIYALFNVTKFIGFIQYSDHLKVPKNLVAATSKGDYPEETTILEHDYINLAKFTFAVRVIYPILFGITSRLTSIMGETHALLNIGQLISHSPSLVSLTGWEKLKLYVKTTFIKHGVGQSLTEFSTGVNSVEKTVFKVIISRLCSSVIPETEKDKHIANVINSVCQTAKSEFNEAFREKEDSYGDTEDKRSVFERYQITENSNPSKEQAEAEWFSFGLFDHNGNPKLHDRFKYQSQTLGIDEQLVEMVYDRIPSNWNFELDRHILTLLQLTFIDDVSPYTFIACDYNQLMAAIALGQVKLASMGYQYLPSVLGCVHDPEGLRTADSLKLNNEDRESIESICSVQAKNTDARSANEAVLAVMDFIENFGNGIWKSNLEVGVLASKEILASYPVGGMYPLEITNNIKVEFVDFILRINQC